MNPGAWLATALLLAAPFPRTSVAVYVYAEDEEAEPDASRASAVMVRRASASGMVVSVEPRLAEILEHAPDDLARDAEALARARAALATGIDLNARLRVESAEEMLGRARAAYLDAAILPAYDELARVHLYLGIVNLNLRDPPAASASFALAAQLRGRRPLDGRQHAPSVVEAYDDARKKLDSKEGRGALRIECDDSGTLLVLDGQPLGTGSRTVPDLSEGEHILEARAPGRRAILRLVRVTAGAQTPLPVTLEPRGPPLRELWASPGGVAGGSAAARILGTDRLLLAAVRATRAGLAPLSVRAALFDPASGKSRGGEATSSRDPATSERQIGQLADGLLRPGAGPGVPAASAAARSRFLGREGILASLELEAMRVDGFYDDGGSYVKGPDAGESAGFREYVETRTTLRLRYGLREGTAISVEVPVVTKSLIDQSFELAPGPDDDGDGNPDYYTRSLLDESERKQRGVGDISISADIRVPRGEGPVLPLLYFTSGLKLPTGNDASPTDLPNYDEAILGSGLYDVWIGAGGVIAGGPARVGLEVRYVAHLPGRVAWLHTAPDGTFRFRRHVDPGDEQRLHAGAGIALGRWLLPEATLDFANRAPTDGFADSATMVLEAGGGVRVDLSERTGFALAARTPVWGVNTGAFFPLEAVGPRASLSWTLRL